MTEPIEKCSICGAEVNLVVDNYRRFPFSSMKIAHTECIKDTICCRTNCLKPVTIVYKGERLCKDHFEMELNPQIINSEAAIVINSPKDVHDNMLKIASREGLLGYIDFLEGINREQGLKLQEKTKAKRDVCGDVIGAMSKEMHDDISKAPKPPFPTQKAWLDEHRREFIERHRGKINNRDIVTFKSEVTMDSIIAQWEKQYAQAKAKYEKENQNAK